MFHPLVPERATNVAEARHEFAYHLDRALASLVA
jgi:hypothetical protein